MSAAFWLDMTRRSDIYFAIILRKGTRPNKETNCATMSFLPARRTFHLGSDFWSWAMFECKTFLSFALIRDFYLEDSEWFVKAKQTLIPYSRKRGDTTGFCKEEGRQSRTNGQNFCVVLVRTKVRSAVRPQVMQKNANFLKRTKICSPCFDMTKYFESFCANHSFGAWTSHGHLVNLLLGWASDWWTFSSRWQTNNFGFVSNPVLFSSLLEPLKSYKNGSSANRFCCSGLDTTFPRSRKIFMIFEFLAVSFSIEPVLCTGSCWKHDIPVGSWGRTDWFPGGGGKPP